MRPKIHNLHDAKSSAFIIATNYENRIDPAINRSGRIDRQCLVPLPNAAKRRAILVGENVPADLVDSGAVRASVFFGYGDLVTVAKDLNSQPIHKMNPTSPAGREELLKLGMRLG